MVREKVRDKTKTWLVLVYLCTHAVLKKIPATNITIKTGTASPGEKMINVIKNIRTTSVII